MVMMITLLHFAFDGMLWWIAYGMDKVDMINYILGMSRIVWVIDYRVYGPTAPANVWGKCLLNRYKSCYSILQLMIFVQPVGQESNPGSQWPCSGSRNRPQKVLWSSNTLLIFFVYRVTWSMFLGAVLLAEVCTQLWILPVSLIYFSSTFQSWKN